MIKKGRYNCAVTVCYLSAFLLAAFLPRSYSYGEEGVQDASRVKDLSASYVWHSVKMGGGGFVIGLVIHPNEADLMYCRTDVGGAYRWDQGTGAWIQILQYPNVPDMRPTDNIVESIAIDPNNPEVVYVATGGDWPGQKNPQGRILKSTDRGNHWIDLGKRWLMNGNWSYRQSSERIAVDPSNSNVVYFGSRQEGLWRSDDAGKAWTQIPTDKLPAGTMTNGQKETFGVACGVVFDPSGGITGDKRTARLYTGVAGLGLYRSDDGGNTWRNISGHARGKAGSPRESKTLDMTPHVPTHAYLGAGGRLYVSFENAVEGNPDPAPILKYNADTEACYDVAPQDQRGWVLGVDPLSKDDASQRLIAGSGMKTQYFCRSDTGGEGWWQRPGYSLRAKEVPWILNTDEGGYLSAGAFVFDPHKPGEVWFAQGMGTWRCRDIAANLPEFEFHPQGIEELCTSDMLAPPGGRPVSILLDRNGFHHTDMDHYPTRPIVSGDHGSGWSGAWVYHQPNKIVALLSNQFSQISNAGWSDDGGMTWTNFLSNGDGQLHGGVIAVSCDNIDNIVWLPTANKPPFYTKDRGKTWTRIDNFPVEGSLHAMMWWNRHSILTADTELPGTFYILSAAHGGEVYRSDDGGVTWNKTASAPPNGTASWVKSQIRALPGLAGHLVASADDKGLWFSKDKGESWTQAPGVEFASTTGVGPALLESKYPTAFFYGKVSGRTGVFRTTDLGATNELLSEHPGGQNHEEPALAGDYNVPGRVYYGLSQGFVYGDDPQILNLMTGCPSADKPGDLYVYPIDVALRSETAESLVRYTLDGTNPGRGKGILYDGKPIHIDHSVVLKAVAEKAGQLPSEVFAAQYDIRTDGKVDVSDLTFAAAGTETEWIGRDRIFGLRPPHPILIGGKIQSKGIWFHGNGFVEYDLGGRFTTFTSFVGAQTADPKQFGNICFKVSLDESVQPAWTSNSTEGKGDAQWCNVDVSGAKRMRLTIEIVGNDHANVSGAWGSPTLQATK